MHCRQNSCLCCIVNLLSTWQQRSLCFVKQARAHDHQKDLSNTDTSALMRQLMRQYPLMSLTTELLHS